MRSSISHIWQNIQTLLFPFLQQELDPLTEKQRKLVAILEVIRIEDFVRSPVWGRGRPESNRQLIMRAFVAKAVYNLPTTRVLIDHLQSSANLRRICGWEKAGDIPSESTFSRAFAECARTGLAEQVHAVLIAEHVKPKLVGHISRDSTAIAAREKPETKAKQEVAVKPKRKRGRPKKGEERPPLPPTRIQQQAAGMSLAAMLEDLPQACNRGCKKNSQGYKQTWNGYKLHLDVADGQIPVSCVLTSASVHDSQVAIPLAEMTSRRVTSLYDLMDSAYDVLEIKEHSRSQGHVPIIDINPRRDKELKRELEAESKRCDVLGLKYPEATRYHERSTVERVYGRLKDEFGGCMVRVRGHGKVMAHLMFGILGLTADQLLRQIC